MNPTRRPDFHAYQAWNARDRLAYHANYACQE
jgi:hypothetical protein